MNPKVSVITVCYNAEEFIEQTINSVLGQTYDNIEYLIIDGNSIDNTVSIINKYINKIDFFSSEPDLGVYDAMNKGIKSASGDILYFLNSDDIFYDEHVVDNVIKIFKSNEDIELVFGSIILNKPSTNESYIKTHANVTKMYFRYGVICQQAIFCKADIFKRYGLFDDSYKIIGDHEWELRIFYKYNINLKYYPNVIVIYRDGGLSCPAQSLELADRERKIMFKKYFNIFEILKYKFILFCKIIIRKLE